MRNSFKWDFFIAHCSADVKEAEKFYACLYKNARVFLDSKTLKLGDDWDIELAKAQQNSAITLILVSANTERAYYQREEIASAITMSRNENLNHRVIPIYLDNVKNVPYGLRLKHGLNIFDDLSIEYVAGLLLDELNSSDNYMHNEKNNGIIYKTCKSEDISLSVSNYNCKDYKSDIFNNYINIEHNCPYLKLCNNNNSSTIENICCISEPFKVDYPSLDFKIVNNSKKTIFLSHVIFEIQESKSDPSPVIYILYDSNYADACRIRLYNDGWGDIKNLKLKVLDISDSKFKSYNISTHIFNVGDFSDYIDVDISKVLKECGINFDKFTIPYTKEEFVIVTGILEFEGFQLDRQMKKYNIKFRTKVSLIDLSFAGAPMPPSYKYKIGFNVEGNNYQRHVPISHVLQPGEADRFVITIGMKQSSKHIFKIRILYNNDKTICFDKSVHLLSFVPKSKNMYSRSDDVIY